MPAVRLSLAAVMAMAFALRRAIAFVPSTSARSNAGCQTVRQWQCRRSVTMAAGAEPIGTRRNVLLRSAALAAASLCSNIASALVATENPILADDAVSQLQQGNKEIYLIGTAHISEKSADLVRDVIRLVKVCTLRIVGI